jgi:hypothetical protein
VSPSKSGLNAEFYQWIDDVRRAMRKEKELQEKLKFYNKKLIGCKGVVYDRIGSPGTAGGERDLYYWIEKIDDVLSKKRIYREVIKKYEIFTKELTVDELTQINTFLSIEDKASPRVQNTRTYRIFNSIIRKWSCS